jgi:hypothetical protein
LREDISDEKLNNYSLWPITPRPGPDRGNVWLYFSTTLIENIVTSCTHDKIIVTSW